VTWNLSGSFYTTHCLRHCPSQRSHLSSELRSLRA